MAIAFDAVSSTAGLKSGGSFTFAHTCTGSNLYLVVGVAMHYNDASTNATAVTYNSVSMTKIGEVAFGSGHGVTLWGLAGPSSGASYNVSVTFGAGGDACYCGAGAVSYTDVHQTTSVGTANTATSDDDVPTVAITSASGEVVVDCCCVKKSYGDATATVGASQTERVNVSSGTDTTQGLGLMSQEAGAASVTMSWTLSRTDPWKIVGIPLKPTGGGGGPPGAPMWIFNPGW